MPEVPAMLRGDARRLRQILVNLLENAVKFTPRGEVTIAVELESETASSATLRFAVTDTGVGIPPCRAVSLFAPFVQGDGSVTRKYGGVGLGLAFAKQVAELMGGMIGVESDEGNGSTFWFTATFEQQFEPAEPAPIAPPRRQGIRILVADDSASERLLMGRVLTRWGGHSARTHGKPVPPRNPDSNSSVSARTAPRKGPYSKDPDEASVKE
jgi:Histidine kinase-, DNA gyrase B-, and HSP90-like ATPase